MPDTGAPTNVGNTLLGDVASPVANQAAAVIGQQLGLTNTGLNLNSLGSGVLSNLISSIPQLLGLQGGGAQMSSWAGGQVSPIIADALQSAFAGEGVGLFSDAAQNAATGVEAVGQGVANSLTSTAISDAVGMVAPVLQIGQWFGGGGGDWNSPVAGYLSNIPFIGGFLASIVQAITGPGNLPSLGDNPTYQQMNTESTNRLSAMKAAGMSDYDIWQWSQANNYVTTMDPNGSTVSSILTPQEAAYQQNYGQAIGYLTSGTPSSNLVQLPGGQGYHWVQSAGQGGDAVPYSVGYQGYETNPVFNQVFSTPQQAYAAASPNSMMGGITPDQARALNMSPADIQALTQAYRPGYDANSQVTVKQTFTEADPSGYGYYTQVPTWQAVDQYGNVIGTSYTGAADAQSQAMSYMKPNQDPNSLAIQEQARSQLGYDYFHGGAPGGDTNMYEGSYIGQYSNTLPTQDQKSQSLGIQYVPSQTDPATMQWISLDPLYWNQLQQYGISPTGQHTGIPTSPNNTTQQLQQAQTQTPVPAATDVAGDRAGAPTYDASAAQTAAAQYQAQVGGSQPQGSAAPQLTDFTGGSMRLQQQKTVPNIASTQTWQDIYNKTFGGSYV